MMSLAEELFLVALDEESGKVAFSGPRYGEAGALLLDLGLAGRLAVAGRRLAAVDTTPTGDPLLDRALALVAESAKQHDAKHWVRKIAGTIKDMDEQVSDRLITRGVLRREEHRVLWIFPAKRYPLLEDEPHESIETRLRRVLIDGGEPDPRTRALIGLCQGADLLKRVMTGDERKAAKKRVETVIAEEPLVAAVAKAIADARRDDAAAASAGAVTASTVATSS